MTRRQLLLAAAAAATAVTGCGSSGSAAAGSGSTLLSTWGDPVGDGQLRVLGGERLLARTELGAPARPAAGGRVLATLAHVTDAHVMDASSPARVPFLDRLGPPFQSTFRPHETLTARVLDGALASINALRPDAVIQGGDLIDNVQANELSCALRILRGGHAQPGSGRHGYYGVQSPGDPDPFYYRPDLDAPRHPGLLRAATAAFDGRGLSAPVHPVLGDHDILVQGELVPYALTQSLAVGDRALWDLPTGLSLPPGVQLTSGGSPDGPPQPGVVGPLLEQALAGPTVRVPPDPRRRELSTGEVIGALRPQSGPTLDYAFDIGPSVRIVVLDLARRDGGSGGLVTPDQPGWLEQQLTGAHDRWVLVFSHQPLISSAGGEQLLAVLDRHPRVLAALAGHIHRNSITPRSTPVGGYWLITTSSLIDYPQQARALQVVSLQGGGVAIRSWMLDHSGLGSTARLGTISRQLSYLDAQGGRPLGFAGARSDRNALLYRRAA